MLPSSRRCGFTLVELLVAMAILFTLVVFGFVGMGVLRHQQDRQKAVTQLAQLSAALERYHVDTGEYPTTEDSASGLATDGMSIAVHVSASPAPTKLFNVLFRDGVVNGTTIYCPELDPVQAFEWVVAPDIIDPWGKPYRYRSELGPPDPSGGAERNPSTQRQGFELWTSGKDGKTSPNSTGKPENADDLESPAGNRPPIRPIQVESRD